MSISGDYSHLGHLISSVKFRALFKNDNLLHNPADVLNSIYIYALYMHYALLCLSI